METTATFYFSTRTLAASDMTPITAPVSDMTTTAANSIFPQEHKHFWHEHNSTSTWHDHNIKFLSYIQEHQQFDMDTTATFYFSTRTLTVSDITPSNSTSLWHDHNSSSFYLYHKNTSNITLPQQQVSTFSTRTSIFDMSTTAPASDMTTTLSFYLIYKNTSNLTWTPQQVSTLAQKH